MKKLYHFSFLRLLWFPLLSALPKFLLFPSALLSALPKFLLFPVFPSGFVIKEVVHPYLTANELILLEVFC